MIFIFGGKYQGKLNFAKTLISNKISKENINKENKIKNKYENKNLKDKEINIKIFDCESTENIFPVEECQIIYNIQKNLKLASNIFEDKIIIGDDISCGIVPLEKSDRDWRDEVGRLYQKLSHEAEEVYRVWCGLPQKIK